jgi:hypothetical protein
MTTKLSDEQREALKACAGGPVRVADEKTNQIYYLLDENAFVHLRGLQSEHEEECRIKLQQLVEEGICSAEIPAAEVFSFLRAEAKKLAGPGA